MRRAILCVSMAGMLLAMAACAAHPAPSPEHPTASPPDTHAATPADTHAATPANTQAATPAGQEVLARAKSAFLSAASVTVRVTSTSEGDDAPPFAHWTETVTARGKTTDPPFTGSRAGSDPISCSSLATCADYYFDTENYPLDVTTAGAGNRRAWLVHAEGSADLALPGWSAIIDAKTYAPVTITAGWSCTHCYYLTYRFHLTARG